MWVDGLGVGRLRSPFQRWISVIVMRRLVSDDVVCETAVKLEFLAVQAFDWLFMFLVSAL